MAIRHTSGLNQILLMNGTLEIAHGNESLAKFIPDGAVELYHDNSKKFETTTGGAKVTGNFIGTGDILCLLYTSPSPRDGLLSRMPSSA